MSEQPHIMEKRMKNRMLVSAAVLIAAMLLTVRAEAQGRLPFEGAWEEISSVNPNRGRGANGGSFRATRNSKPLSTTGC